MNSRRMGTKRRFSTATSLAFIFAVVSVTPLIAVPGWVIPSSASGVISITTPACGAIIFPSATAGSWVIPGTGVDVYSNGPSDEGTLTDCSSASSTVNGITAGEEWQCVEFINRLYLTNGWIDSNWLGSAGPTFYDNAPSNLTEQSNGSVSYLGPGDIVVINVLYNGVSDGGHALVVNDSSDVTSGTVNLVSQNSGYGGTTLPVVPGTLSGGSVTVGGGGSGYTYTTIGVVHAPSTATTTPTFPASPSGTSKSSLSGTITNIGTQKGVAGVCVAAETYESKTLSPVTTGSNGGYTISGLPSGTYEIDVDVGCQGKKESPYIGLYTLPQGWIVLPAGTKLTGINGFVTPNPGAPTHVVATVGNRQTTVSWTAPSMAKGGVITGYYVSQAVDTSVTGVCSTANSSTLTSCTVTGLVNGDTYVFNVQVLTSTGGGDQSDYSNPVQPDPPGTSALPHTVVHFAPGSYVLSGSEKTALTVLARKIDAGASVIVTGFAYEDPSLSGGRELAVKDFLLSKVKIHVTLKFQAELNNNWATVTTTKQ